MRRVVLCIFVALVALMLAGVAGAQSSPINIGVTQEGPNVIIQATQDGGPLTGANVSVSSVGNSTPLDGDYVTDGNGEIVFGENDTKGLSGVIHLRVIVETEDRTSSVLTTIIRSPDVEKSAPLGQRISMSLQNSVANTRGTIEGNMFVTRVESIETNDTQIEVLGDHAESLLGSLSEKKLNEQALGRRLATGGLSLPEFYSRMVQNSAERRSLRSDLEATLDRLLDYSDETLRDNGLDPVSIQIMYIDLSNDEDIEVGRGIR